MGERFCTSFVFDKNVDKWLLIEVTHRKLGEGGPFAIKKSCIRTAKGLRIFARDLDLSLIDEYVAGFFEKEMP